MNVVVPTQRLELGRALYGRDLLPIASLSEARQAGVAGGLVTIVGIDGGSPKPLGTHLAVLADGRHFGHVSGGCVEPAISTEIVPILMQGQDQILRFGKGSSYIDIRFPCGGGADLLIHVAPSADMLDQALVRARRREAFAIAFDPTASHAAIVGSHAKTGWQGGVFLRRYLPPTRLVLAGRGPDFEVMARVAVAAEFEVCLVTPDEASANALADLGAPIELLGSTSQLLQTPTDPWTATVTLFHEHEWENVILTQAASGPGFYVGALGSQRTHRIRRERLLSVGLTNDLVARVRGPIGLVERSKDPGSLALSVLAEVSLARAELEQA